LLEVQKMPAPPYASSMQNLKTVAEKIKWKVQYQERVAEQRFQARVVLTPPGADSVELTWCASAATRKEGQQAAAELALLYFERQPLTLVLGGKYERNETRMRE
jgi:hypothetical protein